MGCLALILGEATILGHIKLGYKYQLNRAIAPLYVTNALWLVLFSRHKYTRVFIFSFIKRQEIAYIDPITV